MKFETFPAGVWRQRYQYKRFEPVPVNHDWAWEDATANPLLEPANRALGELNVFSLIVPDIDLFIERHVVKEAQVQREVRNDLCEALGLLREITGWQRGRAYTVDRYLHFFTR